MKQARFGLRDLFWVTIVSAISTAWYIDHHAVTERHERAIDEITDRYDAELDARVANIEEMYSAAMSLNKGLIVPADDESESAPTQEP